MPKKTKTKTKQKTKPKVRTKVRTVVKQVSAPARSGISGSGLGSLLGSVATTGLKFLGKSILGIGDYKVTSNSLLGSNNVPSFGVDEIRFRRKEYLGDISTLVKGFSITNFPINPGVATTFPWLSKIAPNFEQYKIHGLVFQFVSTSAVAISSTDPALGKLIMASEYDVSQPLFNSTRAMLATLFSNYGKPSDDLIHAIECDRSKSLAETLFVRSGPVPAGSNIQLYDMANFQVASEGLPSATNIGGLWVSYDISFMKPRLSAIAGEPAMDHWYLPDAAVSKGTQLIHNANIGGALSYDSKAGTYTYRFPTGVTSTSYMLTIAWYNTTGSPVATGAGGLWDLFSYVGCAADGMYKQATIGSGVANIKSVGTPTNTLLICYGITVSALGTDRASFQFNNVLPLSYTGAEFMLMQCSMPKSALPFYDAD